MDVFPRLPTPDHVDRAGCDRESPAPLGGGIAAAADVANYVIGQFCLMVFGAFEPAMTVTPLQHLVVRVILRRSQKQVFRVTARRVVALVQNMKAIRDWAIVDRPRQAVRRDHLAPSVDCAVSRFLTCAVPLPALICAAPFNLSPEPIFDRGHLGAACSCAFCRAKTPFLEIASRATVLAGKIELIAAGFASFCKHATLRYQRCNGALWSVV